MGGRLQRNTGIGASVRRRLLRDDRGSVYAMMAAALIPALGFVGTGIDLGRAYLVQSRLQSAVDAAVMAGVRMQQIDAGTGPESLTQKTIQSYLDANFPTGYAGFVRNALVAPTVTREGSKIKLALSVSGQVPTSLMRIFGFAQLPVEASATAEAGETVGEAKAVEVLLVLDNTGSMKADNRIGQLKDAAKSFVEVVYGKDIQTRNNFAIGMLPYNTMANVGRLLLGDGTNATKRALFSPPADLNPYLTADPTTAFSWKGCLFADQTKQVISDDISVIDADVFDIGKNMPGEKAGSGTVNMPKLDPFIYPPIKVDSFQDVDNRYRFPDLATAKFAMNYGPIRTALIRQYGGRALDKSPICSDTNGVAVVCTGSTLIDPARVPEYADTTKWRSPNVYTHKAGGSNGISGPSPNYQCPAQALPIQYDRTQAELRTYIENENAALEPGTGTLHNPAMTWAYRMMARTDFFPRSTPASIPVRKVVIFMTDGNFDSRDDGRKDEKDGKTVLDTAYTAYRSYADKLATPNTDKASTVAVMSKRFAKTCQAMKAEGIEIFTIAFALDSGAQGDATRELFKVCSTDRGTHFFSVASGPDLKAAFTTIAAELVDLHLSK